MPVPSDFELIVGHGEKHHTIATCKAKLSCYIPGFDSSKGDTIMQANKNKLELPYLDLDAFDIVLRVFTGSTVNCLLIIP